MNNGVMEVRARREMFLVEQAGVAKLEMAAKANALTAETITAIVAGRKITAADATEQWLAGENNLKP